MEAGKEGLVNSKILRTAALFVMSVLLVATIPAPPARGDEASLLESLETAVRKNPKDAAAKLDLARYCKKRYNETGDISLLERGIREGVEAVRTDPTLTDGHLFLASALNQLPPGQLWRYPIDDLVSIQTDVLKAHPDMAGTKGFIPYQYFRALLLMNKGGSLNTCMAELKEAIRLNPGYPGAHYLLARIYLTYRQYDLALFEAREVERLEPGSAQSHGLLAMIHSGRMSTVTNCLDDGEVDSGLKEAREAVRLQPQSATSHGLLGDFYLHKGLYDLAVFEAQEALRIRKNRDAHMSLGWALLMRGSYTQAWKEFNEAFLLQKETFEPLRLMAWCNLLAGSPKEAALQVEEYLNTREVLRGPGGYWIASSMILQYLALNQAGRGEEASTLFNRYAVSYGDNVWGYHIVQYLLGTVSPDYLLERAINRCERAGAHFFIGYDRLLKKDRAGAKVSFRKAVETNAFGTLEYAAARVMLERPDQE